MKNLHTIRVEKFKELTNQQIAAIWHHYVTRGYYSVAIYQNSTRILLRDSSEIAFSNTGEECTLDHTTGWIAAGRPRQFLDQIIIKYSKIKDVDDE